MLSVDPSPIEAFRIARLEAGFDLVGHLRSTAARANRNRGRNTYIAFDPDWSAREAQRQEERFSSAAPSPDTPPPLWGLPVSLKDCFDLEGFKTSSGSKFYAAHRPIASGDSAVAARLRIFRDKMDGLFHQFDLLLAPTTPVSILDAATDQSGARAHILRLTTPGSLAGLPAIVLPSPDCGLQLLSAHNDDRFLLSFAACLGRRLAEETAYARNRA